MERNELYRHKKSDKIKWILTGISFVLIFVLIAGLCLQLFGKDKQKPSEWFKKDAICNHENVETVYGKAATYTETGLTDGSKCADCGLVLEEQKEIPMLNSSVHTTETLIIADYAAANGWENGKKYNAVNMGANISVSIDGGTNSGKFYEGNQWRLYQTESASLTIAAANEYEIFNIRITYNFSNDGRLVSKDGVTAYASNTDIALNGERSFTFGVAGSSEGKNGQVKITAIEIEYGFVGAVEGGENETASLRVKKMAATVQSRAVSNVLQLNVGDRIWGNAPILVPFNICEMTQGAWCGEGHCFIVSGDDGNEYYFSIGGAYFDTYEYSFNVYKNDNTHSEFSRRVLVEDLDTIRFGNISYFDISQVFNIPNGIIEEIDLMSLFVCVVELPPEPVKEGHTFVGWYYDEALTQPYDGEPILSDVELYPKFVVKQFTVSFDSCGGSEVVGQTVEWNTAATLTTPTRTGYTFVGWFLENGTEYKNQPITSDTVLTAKWQIKVYTVTFYVNSEVYATKEVEHGQSFVKVAETMNLSLMSVNMESGNPCYDDNGEMIVTEDSTVIAVEMNGTDKVINTVKQNKWAIIGGVVGGVVLIAVIAAICGGTKRKKR